MESFTFFEYLNQLPPSLVYAHLLTGNARGRKIVSSSTCKEISRQFGTTESLTKRFLSLAPETRRQCALAYLYGQTGIKTQKLRGFDDELLRSFLLYVVKDDAGALYFRGFDEFAPALKELCIKQLSAATRPRSAKEQHPYAPWYCLNDQMAVCMLASQGLLKRTKSGDFPKAAADLFKKIAHGFASPWPAGKIDPKDLLIDYAARKKMIVPEAGEYRTNHAAIIECASEPLSSWHDDFLNFCLDRSGAWRRDMIMDLLAAVPALSIDSLCVKGQEQDAWDVFNVLAYTGMVTLHKAEGTLIAAAAPDIERRTKGIEPPSAAVVVMPDFSALLPQECAPLRLYWLSRLGQVISLDRIYKGKIEREPINDSLWRGISGEALLDQLSSWNTPGNVIATVKEWIREFGRIALIDRCAIVAADASVSAQLESYEPLRRIAEPLPAYRVFAIKKGWERQAREILVGLGFDPRMPEEAQASRLEAIDWAEEIPRRYPVTDFAEEKAELPHRAPSGKYSSELKQLDINDMFHVVDYAMLMGYAVQFEYKGSPGLRKGIYAMVPQSYRKGTDPVLVGEPHAGKGPKKFSMRNITAIGVRYA